MSENTHRRRHPSQSTSPDPAEGDFRFEEREKPDTRQDEEAPDPEPEVRRDRPQRADDWARDLAPPSEIDVYRDANVGPVPVDPSSRASAPRPPPSDPAEGYAFGPEPHHAAARAGPKDTRFVRVLTTGVFDLIHLGHIQMLEAAKRLGTELVVIIARDETVRKQKHNPINDEETRRQIVAALKPVDRAVLGRQGDIYQIVKEIRPDVIALGFDQAFDDEQVRLRCAEVGVTVDVVRLPQFDFDLDATRKIVERIGERIQRRELYPREEGT